MEKNQLVEKHAREAGLTDLKSKWAKVAGPIAMKDRLISTALHFAAQGAPWCWRPVHCEDGLDQQTLAGINKLFFDDIKDLKWD